MNSVDVQHDGLGKFRHIAGSDRQSVEQMAAAQQRIWDGQWKRRKEVERKYFSGANAASLRALKKAQAEDQNEEAERTRVALTSILLNAARTRPSADWSALYQRAEFSDPPPGQPAQPKALLEPRRKDFMPPPPRNLLEILNVRGRRRKKAAALAAFKNAHDEWDFTGRWAAQTHDAAMKRYREDYADWDARRFAFHASQSQANARLDSLRRRYARKDPDAVISHCDMVLLAADFPESFPRHWMIDYAAGALVIDYEMPSTDQMPSVKAVRYAEARDAFDTVRLTPAERDQLYAEAVHQTCLAVLHFLFAADTADAIASISFSGWMNFIDRSTGRPGRACIMAVHATKEVFGEIDLTSVDPRGCFRALNGTLGAKLAAMSAG